MFIFCLVTEKTTMPCGIGRAFNFSPVGKKRPYTPFLSLVRKKPGTLKESTNKGEGIGFPFPLFIPNLKTAQGNP